MAGYFKGLKSEYKKIIWPTWKDALKQSVAVVIVSVILGALIKLIDIAATYGLKFF